MLTGALAGAIFPGIACIVKHFYQTNFYLINKPALPFFYSDCFKSYINKDKR